jgi:hypothetical protein
VFARWRHGKYVERRTHLLAELGRDIPRLSNRARYVREVGVEQTLEVRGRAAADIEADLAARGYDPDPTTGAGFNYLQSMSIASLTKERIAEIENEIEKKRAQNDRIVSTTTYDMWLSDLDALEEAYAVHAKFVAESFAGGGAPAPAKGAKSKKLVAKRTATKAKTATVTKATATTKAQATKAKTTTVKPKPKPKPKATTTAAKPKAKAVV